MAQQLHAQMGGDVSGGEEIIKAGAVDLYSQLQGNFPKGSRNDPENSSMAPPMAIRANCEVKFTGKVLRTYPFDDRASLAL